MAELRYTRAPKPELLNLQDVDLRVLDWALAGLKDEARRGSLVLSEREDETLEHLHTLVLAIKRGEVEVTDGLRDGE